MRKFSFFLSMLLATTFICSLIHAAIIEIEADLNPHYTDRIRQYKPGDTSEYWKPNAGRYELSWLSYNSDTRKNSSFNPSHINTLQKEYDYKTHRVTFKINLADLAKDFPTGLVKFKIETVVHDVGKSESNPRFYYIFDFPLSQIDPSFHDRDLKVILHPSMIMHKPPSDSGWGESEICQIKRYVAPTPPFLIQYPDTL